MGNKPAPNQPARRGDIAVLVSRHAGRTEVTLGTVTSVTRDGTVKAWDEPMFTGSEPRSVAIRPGNADQVLIVPGDRVDVNRAMAAYREHVYPGYEMIAPFGAEQEARKFLAQFANQVPAG